jgi:hypothetical protein
MAGFFGPSAEAPRVVHFEVVLTGRRTRAVSSMPLLTRLVFRNPRKNILFAGAARDGDDLRGVISRIIAGRLLRPVSPESER